MKEIRAEIDSNGNVGLDFIGFSGEDCTQERERLRRVLLSLGVALHPKRIDRKSAPQISHEIPQTERRLLGLEG